MPNKDNSYKGYSYLSAHAIPCSHNNTYIHIPMKNMLILNGILHAMKRDETHHAPMSGVLTNSLTHAYAKCENSSLVFNPMTIFSKTKSFCFINQNPLDIPPMSIACVYAFVGHRFSVSHRSSSHVFQHFYGLSLTGIMYNGNYRFFHSKGYLSLLVIPNTHIFFTCHETVRLRWTWSKVSSSPPIL